MVGIHLAVGVCADHPQPRSPAVSAASPGCRDHPSIAFWYLLRAAQVSVFMQATLGVLLVVTGHEAADGPPLPLRGAAAVVSCIAEAARTGAAEREIGELEFEELPADARLDSRSRSSAARWGSWP